MSRLSIQTIQFALKLLKNKDYAPFAFHCTFIVQSFPVVSSEDPTTMKKNEYFPCSSGGSTNSRSIMMNYCISTELKDETLDTRRETEAERCWTGGSPPRPSPDLHPVCPTLLQPPADLHLPSLHLHPLLQAAASEADLVPLELSFWFSPSDRHQYHSSE